MNQPRTDRKSNSQLGEHGQLHQLTTNFAACSWQNVFVIVWRLKTRADDAREIQRHLENFSRQHSKGFFLLTVVQNGAPPPNVEARQAIADYLKAGAERIVAGAVVTAGGLLRVSFVRGVATGLVLLARQSFPFRVCSLDKALELFDEHGQERGISFQPKEFREVLQRLLGRIDEEEPPESSEQGTRWSLFENQEPSAETNRD